MRVKSMAVFCGSSMGNRPEYKKAAVSMARVLAREEISIVYGGSNLGLMAVLADAMLSMGGHITGVIPRTLEDKEIAHRGVSELILVDSMHERKAAMARKADGFVALPGGAGTMEELFEVWTWIQVGLHGKPCGLLNVAGFYDHLVAHLKHMVREGFLRPDYLKALTVTDDPVVLLTAFKSYTPPPDKWNSFTGA